MNAAANIELVAGIDFGTTYSAYAYSYEYEQGKIFINSTWPSGVQTCKEATAILFDENQRFVAFGEDAIDRYSDCADNDMEKKWYFFNRFKMALYQEKNGKNVNRNLMLSAANGKKMQGLKVFSGAINFLKDHLITNVNQRNAGNRITVDSVRWVLTVPAIWGDSAKQFMRESAQMAGIPSRNLIIALEPECASLYCQELPAEKLGEFPDFKKAGAKYLLLDNGGGTVDVTVHQMLEGGRVKELYKATGGAWGGTKVDEAFVKYFRDMFTERVIDELKNQNAPDWIEMMRDFEQIKRKISNDNQDEHIRMMLRPCVQEVYQEIMELNLNTAFKNTADTKGAILNRHRLQIPRSVISEMIERVSKSISAHTDFLMKQTGNDKLDFIVMVGGFSNSPIVVKEVKDLVRGTLPVIVPENAELCVVQGAVIFGWKPDIFQSRKSKRTYGISMVSTFREGIDPERHMFFDDENIKKCRLLFDKLCSVNEDIDLDQTMGRTYYPVYNDQTEMNICVYESERNAVSYCDDEGARRLGLLNVPMQDLTGNKGRKVKVNVRFGDTEFFVNGVDETTGADVKVKFDFL